MRSSTQPSRLWFGWAVLLLCISAAWVPALRTAVEELSHPPPKALPALEAAQITAGAHASYHLALDLLFGAGSWAVAGLLLRRRGRDPLARYAALTLTLWGPANGLGVEAVPGPAGLAWVSRTVAWGAFAMLVVHSIRLHANTRSIRQRQQIRWFLYGAATSIVTMALIGTLIGTGVRLDPTQVDRHMTGHLLLFFAGTIFPAGIVAAWLLPGVPDPDTLIRRTLLYGGLMATFVGASIALIVVPAFYYAELGPVYALTVITGWAVLSVPLQQWLQRWINRLLYGRRSEPLHVLDELGQRLELGSPQTILATIVETVASTLKLPSVTIRGMDGVTLATAGASDLPPIAIPIVHQGERVGELVATPRARDESLDERDFELLRLISRQSGATVHAVRLTQELQHSRQQILVAREEERRRIRRDLHDGLGPSLAAIAMQADTAQALVDDDPAAAKDLLAAVTRDAAEVVQDIRRLVYELRPPALDELGLLGAIELVARHHTTSALSVAVRTQGALPPMQAAIEVAIYRIITEALTNAVRHSNAATCVISLSVSGDGDEEKLVARIDDDGGGIPPGVVPGIGTRSMRERATEVGGDLTLGTSPSGGVSVLVSIPLAGEPENRRTLGSEERT